MSFYNEHLKLPRCELRKKVIEQLHRVLRGGGFVVYVARYYHAVGALLVRCFEYLIQDIFLILKQRVIVQPPT